MKLGIIGVGGFARELAQDLLDLGYDSSQLFFIDDYTPAREVLLGRGFGSARQELLFPVVKDWKFAPNAEFLMGVGLPERKKSLVERALQAGLRPHPTIVHPSAIVQDAQVGMGGVICPNVVVTTNVKIGDYVILNLGATVGHDSVIGDRVTCNPGVSVSGGVKIGAGTLVGVGAIIKENVTLSENCVVGGQAFVHRDVVAEKTVVGVPARELSR